jgi:catechol 2,3-dioxygenase-like lactoylglutathione lyase family enzyme
MTTDAPQFGTERDGEHPDRSDEWERLRSQYLRPAGERPATSAGGVHHQAFICSDVERTIAFYQGLLEFPLTDLFQNRDYEGSTHFFFDIGNGNTIAFFDFPGLGLGPYQEVLGGHHHLAISMPHENWVRMRAKLDDAGVDYWEHKTSLYFTDPDGLRLELLGEPLGQMYGSKVL